MLRNSHVVAFVIHSFFVLASSCSCSAPSTVAEPTQPESRNPLTTFKGGTVLKNDLARALELPPEGVCNEFGLYSCTDKIHKVTLLGVDAYDSQIFEPLPSTSPSTTLAADRVALSACLQRASLDASDPAQAVVFQALTTAEGRKRSIQSLYDRVLARSPSTQELDAFSKLFAQLLLESPEPNESLAQANWATLGCFAVTTSREFLFF